MRSVRVHRRERHRGVRRHVTRRLRSNRATKSTFRLRSSFHSFLLDRQKTAKPVETNIRQVSCIYDVCYQDFRDNFQILVDTVADHI